ncbi:MAG: lipoate protein ligase C-terminal domain-containing protein [Patescibacteria group bacterium]|nr:lipoate protein ligase C-terminal domain-containing protein [Patescibacteria group bacterium]
MLKKSTYKIPEGKLVKIYLKEENKKITEIKINGDFFMHPEKAIEKLEKTLINCALNKKILINKINLFWKENKVDCFGINSQGLTKAILLAK